MVYLIDLGGNLPNRPLTNLKLVSLCSVINSYILQSSSKLVSTRCTIIIKRLK